MQLMTNDQTREKTLEHTEISPPTQTKTVARVVIRAEAPLTVRTRNRVLAHTTTAAPLRWQQGKKRVVTHFPHLNHPQHTSRRVVSRATLRVRRLAIVKCAAGRPGPHIHSQTIPTEHTPHRHLLDNSVTSEPHSITTYLLLTHNVLHAKLRHEAWQRGWLHVMVHTSTRCQGTLGPENVDSHPKINGFEHVLPSVH